MICFPIAKENLVRETAELQQALCHWAASRSCLEHHTPCHWRLRVRENRPAAYPASGRFWEPAGHLKGTWQKGSRPASDPLYHLRAVTSSLWVGVGRCVSTQDPPQTSSSPETGPGIHMLKLLRWFQDTGEVNYHCIWWSLRTPSSPESLPISRLIEWWEVVGWVHHSPADASYNESVSTEFHESISKEVTAVKSWATSYSVFS